MLICDLAYVVEQAITNSSSPNALIGDPVALSTDKVTEKILNY